jgi:hypothetical protein
MNLGDKLNKREVNLFKFFGFGLLLTVIS